MGKNNRLLVLLALPLTVFLWFIGWSLCWAANARNEKKDGRRLNMIVRFGNYGANVRSRNLTLTVKN